MCPAWTLEKNQGRRSFLEFRARFQYRKRLNVWRTVLCMQKNPFLTLKKWSIILERMFDPFFFLVLMQDTFGYPPVENETSIVHSLTQEKYFYPPYSPQPVYGFLMHPDSMKMGFPIYHSTLRESLCKITYVALFIEVASKIWQGPSFFKNSTIFDKKLFPIGNVFFPPNTFIRQSKKSSLPDISFTTIRLLKGFLWIKS
jgi:hypothetical protein